MKIGVVLTDERNVADASRLLRKLRERGWKARCFLTDRGVLALGDPGFRSEAIAASGGVAVCELSVERFGASLAPELLADPVVVGGQYQNAELVHTSDRVISF